MWFKNSSRLAVLAFAVSACGWAQLDTASILGTVVDPSGAVIPGATVVITNQGTSARVTLTTDGNGNYVAPVLPLGTYSVTASSKGFKTYVRENITLRLADRARIDVALEPGEVSERVNVQAEAPLVETASTTLGDVVNTQQVAELPLNGRSLSSLLGLANGVVMLGTAQQRSANGVSQTRLFESGVRFLVDGGDSGQVDSDIVDSAYASAARITRASVDAISEISIQETSFSAEYGQAMGGVVNFITKSGTNDWHGNLFEYFRNEKLDSRNYFNPSNQNKPPFRLNQFGGTLSGPIFKNKLFFFVNYEGIRQRLGVFVNTFTPTQAFRDALPPAVLAEANQLPLPNGPVSPSEPRLGQYNTGLANQLSEDTGSVKIDYLITANDRITGRYNGNGSYTQTFFGVGAGQFRPVPGFLQLAKLTYTKTISPTLLNEAGFAFNRLHDDPRAAGNAAVLSTPIVPSFAGMAPLGPTLFDLLVANNSFTYLDTLTWVKGRQSLKFGTQIVRNQDNKAIIPQGYLIFLSLDDFAKNNPFLALTLGQPRVGMRNTYNDFFVQDDVQLRSNLTLNIGLRYQYDTTPTESHNRISNFDPVTGQLTPVGATIFRAPKYDFGPRIGFAYTPFQSKQTVIRGGYGIFHAPIVAALAQENPGNVPGIAQNATAIFPGVGFPFPPITPASTGMALFAEPINWHTAYTEQWNLNVQHGFGQSTVLQVGYIGNRGLHENPFNELNPINRATGLRPYPEFSTITNFFDGGISSYNALQASVKRRFSHGFTFNVNYTWSHSLDEGGVSFGSGLQNNSNVRADYGNADYDARHNLEFDYTYQAPAIPHLPKIIGEGWQLNGITTMRSGLPFTVTCGCDSAGIGAATARPNVKPGVNPRPADFNLPGNQLNLDAFSVPPPGTYGNLGRNTFHGPSAYNWDFSLFKNFKVTERQTVQFRSEFFNIFNTPQFSNPNAAFNAKVNFGKTLTTIPAVGGFGSNRQIQFALRYGF